MKNTDLIVKLLLSDIADKNILEVACGCADFSISASRYAQGVSCIDLDDSRLSGALPNNIHFEKMDATKMNYPSGSFDTIILYNAFSHIYSQWDSIKKECLRVLKPSGRLYIASTWKLDISLMNEVFESSVEWQKEFFVARIEK